MKSYGNIVNNIALNKLRNPIIERICSINDKVWFFCDLYNIIGSFDCASKKKEWHVIPYKFQIGGFYSDINGYDGSIVVTPGYLTDDIIIFDSINQIFRRVHRKKLRNIHGWRYCSLILFDGLFYAIPRDDTFLIIDRNGNIISDEYYENIFAYLHCYIAVRTKRGFICGAFNHDGFLMVDLENHQASWIWENEFPSKNEEYDIDVYNNVFYVHENNQIFGLDLTNFEIIYKAKTKNEGQGYIRYLNGDYVCVDYFYQKEYEIYDTSLNLIDVREVKPDAKGYYNVYFGGWCLCDDHIVNYNSNNGEIRIIKDIKNDLYESDFLSVPEHVISSMVTFSEEDIFIHEDKVMDLDVYIRLFDH